MRLLFVVLILTLPLAAQGDEFGERFNDEAPVALDESRLWDIAPAAGDQAEEKPKVQILQGEANTVRIRPEGKMPKVIVIEPGAGAETTEEKPDVVLE